MSIGISERTVEVPYLLNSIQQIKPDSILDIGFAGSWYLENILNMGIKVVGIDNCMSRISGHGLLVDNKQKKRWNDILDRLQYVVGDISNIDLPKQLNKFDLVSSISTIEHIVPCGYENFVVDGNADIHAVSNMKKMVNNAGSLLLTFPCGIKTIFSSNLPENKCARSKYNIMVYDSDRIKKLVGDWHIADQKFWTRENNKQSKFVECDPDTALSRKPHIDVPVQSVCAIRIKKHDTK